MVVTAVAIRVHPALALILRNAGAGIANIKALPSLIGSAACWAIRCNWSRIPVAARASRSRCRWRRNSEAQCSCRWRCTLPTSREASG